jgi:alpha-D-ribose 1-methylphosphonate 5-triphosphate synthase subunit PhnH
MIGSGFADPVRSAQAAFRIILDATSRPGTVRAMTADVTAPPPPLSPAVAAIALTLCDQDTPVWLDAPLRASQDVAAWLRFHCGTRIVDDPQAASFAFAGDARSLPAFEYFNLGSADYPDRSTMIVLHVDSFAAGPELLLEGPGIKSRQSLRAAPLPDDITARLVANRGLFPRGIDLILASADKIAVLPRSVRLAHAGASDGGATCM